MSRTPDIEVVKHRETWTPSQANLILGRGVDFWRAALLQGRVAGTVEGTEKRKTYRIDAESARELNRSTGRRVVVAQQESESLRAKIADWRAKRKRERESNVHTDTVAVRQP